MGRCVAIIALIKVAAHIGIPTRRIAMADSIADTTTAITILVRDRDVCLTNNAQTLLSVRMT